MDVADKLVSISNSSVKFPHPTDNNKALIDLFEITKLQAAAKGISEKNILHFGQNTFTGPEYASYRRDKPNAGRQISFICKTS